MGTGEIPPSLLPLVGLVPQVPADPRVLEQVAPAVRPDLVAPQNARAVRDAFELQDLDRHPPPVVGPFHARDELGPAAGHLAELFGRHARQGGDPAGAIGTARPPPVVALPAVTAPHTAVALRAAVALTRWHGPLPAGARPGEPGPPVRRGRARRRRSRRPRGPLRSRRAAAGCRPRRTSPRPRSPPASWRPTRRRTRAPAAARRSWSAAPSAPPPSCRNGRVVADEAPRRHRAGHAGQQLDPIRLGRLGRLPESGGLPPVHEERRAQHLDLDARLGGPDVGRHRSERLEEPAGVPAPALLQGADHQPPELEL